MSNIKKSVINLALAASVIAFSTVGTVSNAAGNKTMEEHYDTYEMWYLYDGGIPDIVSKEYKPDAKTKKLLDQAEKVGLEDPFQPFNAKVAEGEAYYKVAAQTPNFTIFYIGGIESTSMIMKIGDSEYLEVGVPAISYTGDEPEYMEYDIDNDGELELIYEPSRLFHGTGYYEEFILIVDTDKNSKWTVYTLNPQKYMPEIAKQVEGKFINGKATLLVNGKEEGIAVPESEIPEGMNPGLYLENVVNIDIYDGIIWVGSEPMFDAASMSGPDVIVYYPITYEGEGKYSGDKVICRPGYYDVYRDTIDSFGENDLYYIWRNPKLDMPLMLTADLKDSLDKELKYNIKVPSCKATVLENNKLKELETLEGDKSKQPICISPDGLVEKGEHYIYVYGPDDTGKGLIIKDGAEDNTVSNFSKHKGYIRIRNGKAENINKNEYEAILKTYEGATPLSFNSK